MKIKQAAPNDPQQQDMQCGGSSDGDSSQMALEAFCKHEEQSYDDFIQSFTHLSHDDVQQHELKKAAVLAMKSAEEGSSSEEQIPACSTVVNTPSPAVIAAETIHEQVLQEGVSSISVSGKGNVRLKVDNFMEDEACSDDADEDDNIYSASFTSPTNTRSVTLSEEKQLHVTSSQQNDKNKQTITNAADCVLQESNKNTDNKPVVFDSTGEVYTDFVSDELGIDLDPDEIHIDEDNAYPGEITEVKGQTEVKAGSTTLEFGAKNADTVTVVQNVTESNEKSQEDSSKSIDSNDCIQDDVIPFELDEEFDYDNVTLTPKFTVTEMAYLESLKPNTSK